MMINDNDKSLFDSSSTQLNFRCFQNRKKKIPECIKEIEIWHKINLFYYDIQITKQHSIICYNSMHH